MKKFILLKTPDELLSLNESQLNEISGVFFNRKNKDMITFHNFLSKSRKKIDHFENKIVLSESHQKDSTLSLIENDLYSNERLKNIIVTCANELIMNAFFDAPQKDGQQLYSTKPRNENVSGQVLVSWELSNNYFKLLVEDSFGTLNKNKLIRHLGKSYKNENYEIDPLQAGAGIGLRQSVEKGANLIFKSELNQYTQVVALFKIEESFKQTKEWSNFVITSINQK